MTTLGSFLTDQLLKGGLILFLVLLVLLALRKRSAANRSAFISTALLSLAVLPLTYHTFPALRWPIRLHATQAHLPASVSSPPARLAGLVVVTAPHVRTASASATHLWSRTFPILWLAGFVFVLIRFASAYVRLLSLRSSSFPPRDARLHETLECLVGASSRRMTLLLSQECRVPMTWGILRQVIILPADAGHWPESRLEIALRHELSHIRRRDWAARLFAQVICAFHWCNPLIWIICRQYRFAQEQACDDLVLASGAPPAAYAEALIEAVRKLRPQPDPLSALAMAQASTLSRRVQAILDPARARACAASPSAIFAAGVSSLILLVASGLAQITPPEPQTSPSGTGTPFAADSSRQPIEFAVRFIEIHGSTIPDRFAQSLQLDATSASTILSPAQTPAFETNFQQIVSEQAGVDLLSAPRLIIESGKEGIIEIGHPLPLAKDQPQGASIETGFTCKLSATLQDPDRLALTTSATNRALRAEKDQPKASRTVETAVLKPTTNSLSFGGIAVFRLSGPHDATSSLWMLVSPQKAKEAKPAAPDRPAVAGSPASLPEKADATSSAATAVSHFGDHPIEVNAEETRFEGGICIAVGHANLTHKATSIWGDTVRYNPSNRTATAIGHVIFMDPSSSIEADELEYALEPGVIRTVSPSRVAIHDRSDVGASPRSP